MRKNILLLLTLSISLQTALFAQDDCPELAQQAQQASGIEPSVKLATKMAIIADKVSDDNEVKVDAAATYLASITGTSNFNVDEANHFISNITPICENANLAASFRSVACTRLSGLHAKLAMKLGMSGVTNGTKGYSYLQMALRLDPSNQDAVLGHATAVVGISHQSFLIRKVAERTLNVTTAEEAKKAKENLERLKLTNNPLYSQIVDIN